MPNGEVPTSTWTVTQPWRGVFGMLVCLGIAIGITFVWFKDIAGYTSLMGNWAMCIVPIEVVVGVAWAGRYPGERLEQPWKGFAQLLFMFTIATLAFVWLTYIVGGGDPRSGILTCFIIFSVIVTMYWVIAFGCWPFHKMSLPAKGFLTLIGAYLVLMAGFRLLNFDEVGVGAAHGYVPFLPDVGINPGGPIPWDQGVTFFFMMIMFLFVFVHLGMWPFSKFKSLMVQPVLGITLFIATFALGFITYAILVWGMDLSPLRVLAYGVCFAFGMLGILFMFQMWPGRLWKPPVGGFINLLIAAVLAIIAFFAFRAFCIMVFGAEVPIGLHEGAPLVGLFAMDPESHFLMPGPFGWFAMATAMLALTFPAWSMYAPCFDFYPLPPTPAPPG